MFESIKYRLELSKLFKRKKKINQNYSKLIRVAEKEKRPEEEIDGLCSEAAFEDDILDEEISLLVTNYLEGQSKRYFLPLPERNDQKMWTECGIISKQRVLTSHGISEVRSALRKEAKERMEIIFTFLVILTGIIGAITGLLAILLRR